MGRPMVDRLLQAGHDVTVLARREEVRADVAAAGAKVVSTPAEAARGADVVVVCLFSDDQLLEVSDDLLSGLGDGAVIASHVTGRRSTVQELGARAGARGGHVVDAPVSGGGGEIKSGRLPGPPGGEPAAVGARAGARGGHVVDAPVSGGVDEINAGRLTVLLGGNPAAVDAADAVVAAYGDPRIRTGALGSALAVKLVNNLLFATHSQTAAAAVELGARLGVGQAPPLQGLGAPSGPALPPSSLTRTGPAEPWGQGIGGFLRKDVAACE